MVQFVARSWAWGVGGGREGERASEAIGMGKELKT